MRKRHLTVLFSAAVLFTGAACLYAPTAWAGSCCGGGAAATLVLPKFSRGMVDVSMDMEQYNGFWNQDGKYTHDAPGSDLRQYRLNLGYAHRLASRWQASVAIPYVWNDNKYSGLTSSSDGIGDTTVNLWYETFDGVKCVWKVRSTEDLMPAVYLGTSLTIPTGISPYDNVQSSFDVTGRGFYRLDGNVLVDKTIYPWSASIGMSYGQYIERPVDREYGNYVDPYHKKLGDRTLGTVAFSYIYFLESRDMLTYTASFAYLNEAEGTVNGDRDTTSGFRKESVAGTIAYSSMDRDWIYKFTWSHAVREDGWGMNFPTTDIYTIGVSHGFR
jgi:hypothetical protein